MQITKSIIFLIFICIYAFPANSQERLVNDSVLVNRLIEKKIRKLGLADDNVVMTIYSNDGKLLLICQEEEKIKAYMCNYKQAGKQKFKHLRLTKEDRRNFKRSILWANEKASFTFNNCNEAVHSFSTITLKVSLSTGVAQGTFTSDCMDALKNNKLDFLYLIFRKLFWS